MFLKPTEFCKLFEDGSVEIHSVKKLCKKYQAGKAGAALTHLRCTFPSYSWGEMELDSVTLAVPWSCERKNSCVKAWECEIQWKWLMVEMDRLLKGRQRFQSECGLWATPSFSDVCAVPLSRRTCKQNSNWPYTAGDTEICTRIKLFFG